MWYVLGLGVLGLLVMALVGICACVLGARMEARARSEAPEPASSGALLRDTE